MMEKLTIEHLAPYLPYGLQYQGNQCRPLVCSENIEGIIVRQLKPILRPLSDLNQKKYLDKLDSYCHAGFIKTTLKAWVYHIEQGNVLHIPFYIVKKLIEWHFDVFELIRKGLAIDINTLES